MLLNSIIKVMVEKTCCNSRFLTSVIEGLSKKNRLRYEYEPVLKLLHFHYNSKFRKV